MSIFKTLISFTRLSKNKMESTIISHSECESTKHLLCCIRGIFLTGMLSRWLLSYTHLSSHLLSDSDWTIDTCLVKFCQEVWLLFSHCSLLVSVSRSLSIIALAWVKWLLCSYRCKRTLVFSTLIWLELNHCSVVISVCGGLFIINLAWVKPLFCSYLCEQTGLFIIDLACVKSLLCSYLCEHSGLFSIALAWVEPLFCSYLCEKRPFHHWSGSR